MYYRYREPHKHRVAWSRYGFWYAVSPCNNGRTFAFAQMLNKLNVPASPYWH